MLSGSAEDLWLSEAKHGVRVAIDEEGVTAAGLYRNGHVRSRSPAGE